MNCTILCQRSSSNFVLKSYLGVFVISNDHLTGKVIPGVVLYVDDLVLCVDPVAHSVEGYPSGQPVG